MADDTSRYGQGGTAIAPGRSADYFGPQPDWKANLERDWPTPIYCTGEDNIQVAALNPNINTNVTWRARMLVIDDDGKSRIVPIVRTFLSNGSSNYTVDTQRLPEGWLLQMDATAAISTPLLGQCWIEFRLVRGLTGAIQQQGVLARGYVTNNISVFWPEGFYGGPVDFSVAVRSVQQANPAAGAEFIITVPASTRWELISVNATLTTAVAAGTRLPRLILDDGVNTLFEAPASVSQAPSLTIIRSWGAGSGGPVTQDAGASSDPFPNGFFLSGGWRIRTSTAALAAADTWTNISVGVRETVVV